MNLLNLAGMAHGDLERLRIELRDIQSVHSRGHKMAARLLGEVNEAIRMRTQPVEDLIITDHAIVRWLERIDGVDLDPVRNRIRAIAAGRFDPKEDHEIVVSEDHGVALVLRGDRSGPVPQAAVTTVLSTAYEIPVKGQLSMKRKDD